VRLWGGQYAEANKRGARLMGYIGQDADDSEIWAPGPPAEPCGDPHCTTHGAPMKPTRITIHHTATASGPGHEVVEQIRRYHVEERGWSDIAYHVLIDNAGERFTGRPIEQAPDSHSDFDFTGHIAIALLGHFTRSTYVNDETWESLVQVVRQLAREYDVPPENIKGHRDYADTLCPGRYLYELLPELRKSVSGDEGEHDG
jgi:hypothetical protein